MRCNQKTGQTGKWGRPFTLFTNHIVRPPRTVRRARLDNIALVPASLLSHKGKYQTIANNLPKGGVLICQTKKQQRISHILARVARFLRENGHVVRTLPYSMLL